MIREQMVVPMRKAALRGAARPARRRKPGYCSDFGARSPMDEASGSCGFAAAAGRGGSGVSNWYPGSTCCLFQVSLISFHAPTMDRGLGISGARILCSLLRR